MEREAHIRTADLTNFSSQKERKHGLEFFHDVKLGVAVEFGTATITIRNLIGLKAGSVITLDKPQGEPMDVKLNGRLVARGETVVVNDQLGVRVTEIVDPESSTLAALATESKQRDSTSSNRR